MEYQGKKNQTRGGHFCQAWRSQTPHNHTYTDDGLFPDTRVADAANYCRNPGGNNLSKPEGPWCYTTSASIEWEYCDVNECGMYQCVYVTYTHTHTHLCVCKCAGTEQNLYIRI